MSIFDLKVDEFLKQSEAQSEKLRREREKEERFARELPGLIASRNKLADRITATQNRIDEFYNVAKEMELPPVLREAFNGIKISAADSAENKAEKMVETQSGSYEIAESEDTTTPAGALRAMEIKAADQEEEFSDILHSGNMFLNKFDELFTAVEDLDEKGQILFYEQSADCKRKVIVNCKLMAFWNSRFTAAIFSGDIGELNHRLYRNSNTIQFVYRSFDTMVIRDGIESKDSNEDSHTGGNIGKPSGGIYGKAK